jgi:REP element-mobilizing transposase RayT
MARPWRIQFENAVYHITTRGNNWQNIFLDDGDRVIFLKLLDRAITRFKLEVFAFSLMSNHYHLFLRTPEANLSPAMHWLNGTYTVYFNFKHKRIGHLFQGRFKSVLVLDDAHWLHLSMYVHLNPVRAGMVQDPARYKWSSFADYIGLKPRFAWLQRDEILSRYGSSRIARLRNYRKECLELAGFKPPFVEQLKRGITIGPAALKEELLKKYRPVGKAGEVPEYARTARESVNPGRELRRVAKAFGVKPERLKNRARNFPARQAAYYHLVEHCGMSMKEAAGLMGVSPKAISIGISRFAQGLDQDRTLQVRMKSLCSM